MAQTKEQHTAYMREYRRMNKNDVNGKERARKLKQRYGVSAEDWQIMFDNQAGCCAICNTHQSDLTKTLCVDHCHSTGKVRGLLCDRCNKCIGSFEDNIDLLDNAKSYLIKNI